MSNGNNVRLRCNNWKIVLLFGESDKTLFTWSFTVPPLPYSYKLQRFNGKSKTWEDINIVDGIPELRETIETLEATIDMQRIKMLHMANAIANQLPNRDKFFADFLGPDNDSPSDCPLP
jgi:hypothetical protein